MTGKIIHFQLSENLKTESAARLHGLDNLRAFAILFVFLFHSNRWFEHPDWFLKAFQFGWTGVDLFFVLSGFLISSQLLAQIKTDSRFSMKAFYIKRMFRILPVYYFVLIIYFLFPFFSNDFGRGQTLPPLWKFLTFTQNLGGDFAHARSLGMVWSLCVEEHFYLVLPITLFLLLKTGWFNKGWLLLIILFIVGFLIRWFAWNHMEYMHNDAAIFKANWINIIYFPTWCRLDGLLTGVAIAIVYNYLPAFFTPFSRYANGLIALGILILTAAYFLFGNDYNFGRTVFAFPVVSVGFGLLVLGAVMPNSFLYQWKSAIMTRIADISYAFYLTHMAVILSTQSLFASFGMAKNSSLLFLLSVVFCSVVALLLHYGIEKPFMKMRKRFT